MFPTILWIAITQEKTRTSKDVSVAVCFDKNGLGVEVGALLPTGKDSNYCGVYRGKTPKLMVDGCSEFTKYNDKFINPTEFLACELLEVNFLNKIIKSLYLIKDTSTQR